MTNPIQNRHDFVLLFDVKDGNPNGDPDAGNLPRIDAETGDGLITDVCLKRKVRNFVALKHSYTAPHDIFVKEKSILNETMERAYTTLGLPIDVHSGKENDKSTKPKKGNKKMSPEEKEKARERVNAEQEKEKKARQWMCQNFFDIRTFGAVMSTGDAKCGQVRGPVQMTFARSVRPVFFLEHSITRMAVATLGEAQDQDGDNRTMGRKHTIPYGLYRAHGFVSAPLANQTGFGDDDLALLWEALENMFEHDRSAARGEMVVRGLYVFKHECQLGNAPAHKLFGHVSAKPAEGYGEGGKPPRQFEHFVVEASDPGIAGVTLERRIG